MSSEALHPDEINRILEQPHWEPPGGSKLTEEDEVAIMRLMAQGAEELGPEVVNDVVMKLVVKWEKELRVNHPDHPALSFIDEARKLGKIP